MGSNQERNGPERCAQRCKFARLEVRISICVELTAGEVGPLSEMEYLWLSTMWNTLQKRNQL